MGPDGTLVIRNMEERDGGVYHCLASSLAGTDTMNSILTYIGELHIHTVALVLQNLPFLTLVLYH